MSPPDPVAHADPAISIAENGSAPAPAEGTSSATDSSDVATAASVPEPSSPGREPAAADAPTASQTFLGLSRGDTRFAVLVGTVILMLMLAHWMKLTISGERRVEIDRLPSRAYEFQLDINRATWVEWMQLEGIGEALARRIVADRESNGPFTAVDDLSRVKGIGPKTLDTIRPHLGCPDCPTTETPP